MEERKIESSEGRSGSGRPIVGWPFPILGALAIQIGVTACVVAIPPSDAEALYLRWFRTIDEHPIRCLLGFGLLIAATRGGRG